MKKAAGLTLVQYLAWTTFAAALNFAIWRLNVLRHREEHKHYIATHGEDMPEIRNWKWDNTK